jgi:hypothetical protein
MLFKINGERNSGTNFLTELLKSNNFPVYVQENKKRVCFHWKHGVPDNSVKQKDDCVVDIFIFRKLDDWLVSFWKNPYHLKQIKNFKNFLSEKQKSREKVLLDSRTNRILNEDDNNKNIFEIRYYKFNKILEYKEKYKNVIFVNLNFLQNNENALYFLNILNKKYMKRECINYIPTIEKHTKNKKCTIQNREYTVNISDYYNDIKKYKNNEIETIIDNIQLEIYE